MVSLNQIVNFDWTYLSYGFDGIETVGPTSASHLSRPRKQRGTVHHRSTVALRRQSRFLRRGHSRVFSFDHQRTFPHRVDHHRWNVSNIADVLDCFLSDHTLPTQSDEKTESHPFVRSTTADPTTNRNSTFVILLVPTANHPNPIWRTWACLFNHSTERISLHLLRWFVLFVYLAASTGVGSRPLSIHHQEKESHSSTTDLCSVTVCRRSFSSASKRWKHRTLSDQRYYCQTMCLPVICITRCSFCRLSAWSFWTTIAFVLRCFFFFIETRGKQRPRKTDSSWSTNEIYGHQHSLYSETKICDQLCAEVFYASSCHWYLRALDFTWTLHIVPIDV